MIGEFIILKDDIMNNIKAIEVAIECINQAILFENNAFFMNTERLNHQGYDMPMASRGEHERKLQEYGFSKTMLQDMLDRVEFNLQ